MPGALAGAARIKLDGVLNTTIYSYGMEEKVALTDDQIDALIALPKIITNPRARKIEKRGSEQVNYDAEGPAGEQFRVYLRQNIRITDGFSCGLLYVAPNGESITLTRYNGADHEHANPLDSATPLPLACHIHRATEKYMAAGRKAEHYAVTTDRYQTLQGAVRALLLDCNITGLDDNPDTEQLLLL